MTLRVMVFMLFSLALTSGGDATTWYVDQTAPAEGDGSSWERAFKTIQAARDVAGDGDTIVVAPGTYWAQSGDIHFVKAVSLRSSNPDDPDIVSTTIVEETTIRATAGQPSFTFSGFTVRGGEVSLACRSVTVTRNALVGLPSANNCGLYIASAGGLVAGNIVSGHRMGGICLYRSSVTLTNNLIWGNSTERSGGAILCEKSSPLIINNAIVGNFAAWAGGGICCDDESAPTITNCILWENGDDLYNCHARYSCIEDGDPGEGNFCYYPYFSDSDNGDYRLEPWSPCIDAGDPSSGFGLEPAPNGGRINMGAYGNTVEAACRYADAGGDGLPDGWEILHFGHLDYGGEEDPDGDGIWNATEYLFGWDPMSPATALVENVTRGKCYQRIQPAIFEADDGDELVALPGDHRGSIDFMGKALVLRSVDPLDAEIVASTIIEGDTGDVVNFKTAECRTSQLCGMTIQHPAGLIGRGAFCDGSSPTIRLNIIRHNTMTDNLGIPSGQNTGGGIYVHGGSPLIELNTIMENSADYGAAIYCVSARPVIKGNSITGNHVHSGALYLASCPLAVIEKNRITKNTGEWCAGLTARYSHIRAVGNLVAGNSFAGVRHLECTGIIRNCTIAANEGIGIARGHAPIVPVVSNCILWGNGDDLVDQQALYSCIQSGDPGQGNIHVDPRFINPVEGDYGLMADSPCINAGNTAAALEVGISPVDHGTLISWSAGADLNGNPRISGRAVDMGAYEYQEGPPDLHFLIEYSSDMKSWEAVDVGPAWEWLDDVPDGLGARFYRIGVQ